MRASWRSATLSFSLSVSLSLFFSRTLSLVLSLPISLSLTQSLSLSHTITHLGAGDSVEAVEHARQLEERHHSRPVRIRANLVLGLGVECTGIIRQCLFPRRIRQGLPLGLYSRPWPRTLCKSYRCPANIAHGRQAMPASGLGFQMNVHKTF